jgi:hypothetical protein
MLAGSMRRVTLAGAWLLAAFVSGCVLLAIAPGVAPAAQQLRVPEPRPGGIELVAVVFKIHFRHQPPGLHPGLRVPRRAQPHTLGVLAAVRRTHVSHHVATYVLLLEALRPLTSARASAGASNQPPSDALDNILDYFLRHFPASYETKIREVPDLLNEIPAERDAVDRIWKEFFEKDFFLELRLEDVNAAFLGDGNPFGLDHKVATQVWDDTWTNLTASEERIEDVIGEIEGLIHRQLEDTPTARSLTLTCPSTVQANSPLDVGGKVSPGLTVPVTLTYTEPDGTAKIVHTVLTSPSGAFSDSTSAGIAGTWVVQANDAGVVSTPCTTIVTAALLPSTPPPQPSPLETKLTVQCPAMAKTSEMIAVNGTLTPGLSGASITITYTTPTGPVTHTVVTESSGNYMDSIPASESSELGNWSIHAGYAGDSQHKPSESTACTTEVVPSVP